MTEEMGLATLLAEEKNPDSDAGLMTPIQNAVENPRIEFREGQYVFCMTNEAGGLVERFVSPAAVRQAFTNLPVESGWLPPGIARWGNGIIGEWAVAFIPPAVHELEITRETAGIEATAAGDVMPGTPVVTNQEVDHLRVPLPGLVWFGIGTHYHIWAVKTETLQPHQEIYRVPLPNVYQDGSICWGQVKPERMTAVTLSKAYDLLMSATFTNHLTAGKSKREREDVRIVLRDLAVTEAMGSGPFCECGDRKSEHAVFVDHDECGGRNCSGRDEPCCEFRVGPAPMPPLYPVDDLMRQVEHTGVSLDAAIRQYFQTGEMPS